jgi:hypothetical protein
MGELIARDLSACTGVSQLHERVSHMAIDQLMSFDLGKSGNAQKETRPSFSSRHCYGSGGLNGAMSDGLGATISPPNEDVKCSLRPIQSQPRYALRCHGFSMVETAH